MTDDIKTTIRSILADMKTPDGGADVVSRKMVSDIFVADGKAFFSLTVPAKDAEAFEPFRVEAERYVEQLDGITKAMVALTAEKQAGQPSAAPAPIEARRQSPPPAPRGAPARATKPGIPNIDKIVAVASGKGGVGKSTTAVNLALGFRDLGLKVGILDADIYGPSMPRLLSLTDRKPESAGGRLLKPLEAYGIKVMSIGLLVSEETAMVWRGPMVVSALNQMMREVEWGHLDILVVDMPPGTGDAQLTMAQQVPLAGAVIVSTPQDLSLIDARRGITMFRKVDVPILGIVENMSYFIAPDTGTRYEIFGHGGAEAEAAKQDVPFLGAMPLDMHIRVRSDEGVPIVQAEPDGPHAELYRDMAARALAGLEKDTQHTTSPTIVFD
ncbi:Mrp/NBP35 family ATP-binding protein [Fulvimarina sp. 2208YS6-2-32]|uniref:Iron-sulfur cluster carrier protein n=1 Tax=Fulvimarina uroteuthidis TaxID=3098149 RepID=A0ABU5I654_9HYPH|nr:Mrp/NBP35 family ATP-binding protein [Fulvimarina sp. 2208YS6-2-32]MDY8110388.1 Mrp/NBP35 family ATP-binding protein [Fulvimarina sp. 2208YS6-2-32]